MIIKLMSKNIEKVKTQTTTLQITHLITMFLIVVQEKIEIITQIEVIDHQIVAQETIAQIVIETLTHQDQVKISSSNASTSSTPGTFKNSQDAHKYADEEINRLAKENKKGYEYTLGRNNKGEVTVNIKPKK